MSFLNEIKKILDKSTLRIDRYLQMMNEPHRYYHNLKHVEELFNLINKFYKDDPDKEDLQQLATMHDIIYNPKQINGENEKQSADFMAGMFYVTDNSRKLYNAIIDTATHKNYSSELSRKFGELDMYILKSEFVSDLIEYENQIMKEYQFVDYSVYKQKRLEFLTSLDENEYPNIFQLIDYVQNRKISVGIYSGSFNPFHIGHQYILNQADLLFDKVIINIGYNPDKINEHTEKNVDYLKSKLYHQVDNFKGLLADYFNQFQDNLYSNVTIIRGIRNEKDLEFEQTQLQYLLDLNPNIKMIFIPTKLELSHISSSGIKTLQKFNTSVDKYLI